MDWISRPLHQGGSNKQVYLMSVQVSAMSKWHKTLTALISLTPTLLARTKFQFSLWRKKDLRAFWDLQRNQIPTRKFSLGIEAPEFHTATRSVFDFHFFSCFHIQWPADYGPIYGSDYRLLTCYGERSDAVQDVWNSCTSQPAFLNILNWCRLCE